MRVAILGNSGSGKSSLAHRLAAAAKGTVLDLDTVAWEPGKVAIARDPAVAVADVQAFCTSHADWVVEGCYASLVGATLSHEPHLVFLDPGLEACLANCRARPWESHKYESKEEQDRHLDFLLSWVVEYYRRDGDMSFPDHRALFDHYPGPKQHVRELPGPEFHLVAD